MPLTTCAKIKLAFSTLMACEKFKTFATNMANARQSIINQRFKIIILIQYTIWKFFKILRPLILYFAVFIQSYILL